MLRSFLSDGDLSFSNLSRLASFLLDIDDLLGGVHLDVSLGRKVRPDSSVGSVGSSASLGSSINLDVVDGQVLHILGVGIGFEVVNQTEHDLD